MTVLVVWPTHEENFRTALHMRLHPKYGSQQGGGSPFGGRPYWISVWRWRVSIIKL